MSLNSKETYARHQRAILSYFGYSPFDEVAKTITTNEIYALIRVKFRPKAVLLEIRLKFGSSKSIQSHAIYGVEK